jgi:serine O-acetyltransferase
VTFWQLVESDFCRLRSDFSIRRFFSLFISHPGLRVVFFLRLQQKAYKVGWFRLANYFRIMMLKNFGIDSVPGVTLGYGLRIEHPSGIVFGKGAVIGNNCTFMSNVTLGARLSHLTEIGGYPKVGNGVFIGTGASVLGSLTLGENSLIGAHAIVLTDVKPNATVTGIHKKVGM